MQKKHLLFTVMMILFSLLLTPQKITFAEESVSEYRKEIELLKAEVASLKKTLFTHMQATQNNHTNTSSDASTTNTSEEFSRLREEMKQLMEEPTAQTTSTDSATFYDDELNLKENPDHYLMTWNLPGVDKNKININITAQDILITGEKKSISEKTDPQTGFSRTDIELGSFSRKLSLPKNIASDSIEAKYQNGILEILMKKQKGIGAPVISRNIPVA